MKPQVKPPMPFTRALRILPSFVAHCGNGISDLSILRARVQGELKNLSHLLLEQLGQTNTGSFYTNEINATDRKITQLKNFLEDTK